ncbi:ATP-binding protein, partial [Methylopila henanensis]
ASAREAQARFDMIAGSVEDLATRHGPNGAVTFASAASERLLGASARDLHGSGLFDRVHIADRPAFLQAIASAAAGGRRSSVEVRLRRAAPAGCAPRFGWFHMTARPGAEAGVALAMFRDVTDARALAERVEQAEQAAALATAEKSRFLASVSHELRTPLTAILGFSEILSESPAPAEVVGRRSDYGRLIHQSAQHLLEIVDGVLDVAKIETGAFPVASEPCALAPLVARCVGLLALDAERGGVRVVADVGADVPEIAADRRALTQVILNLLSNAIKFTPSGGEVSVSLRARGDAALIVVRDTGVGVAPEHVGRLGEAFFQVPNAGGGSRQGSGLGLSIARGLVDLHGGRIGFESVVGRGTRVTVSLPLDPARPLTEAPVERPAFGRPRPVSPLELKVKKSA